MDTKPSIYTGEKAYTSFLEYYKSLPSDEDRNPLFSSDLLVLWKLPSKKNKPGTFTKSDGVGTFLVWKDYIVLLAWRDPEVKDKTSGEKVKEFAYKFATELLSSLTDNFSKLITDRIDKSVLGEDPNIIALKQKNMNPWDLLGSPKSRYFPLQEIEHMNEEKFMTAKGFLLKLQNDETFFIMPYLGEGADRESAIKFKNYIEYLKG